MTRPLQQKHRPLQSSVTPGFLASTDCYAVMQQILWMLQSSWTAKRQIFV
jgi:hypothetical protein